MKEEEIIKEVKGYLDFEEGISMRAIQGLLDLYTKEKKKNKKAIGMLEEHIQHCEREAAGSLHNEVCHIALKFDNHLLEILEEE